MGGVVLFFRITGNNVLNSCNEVSRTLQAHKNSGLYSRKHTRDLPFQQHPAGFLSASDSCIPGELISLGGCGEAC